MHERFRPAGRPAVATVHAAEEGHTCSRADPPPRGERGPDPVRGGAQGVRLDADFPPHSLPVGLRREAQEHRDHQVAATRPATRDSRPGHPTCTSLVTLRSGASEAITEQYFSTESSTA